MQTFYNNRAVFPINIIKMRCIWILGKWKEKKGKGNKLKRVLTWRLLSGSFCLSKSQEIEGRRSPTLPESTGSNLGGNPCQRQMWSLQRLCLVPQSSCLPPETRSRPGSRLDRRRLRSSHRCECGYPRLSSQNPCRSLNLRRKWGGFTRRRWRRKKREKRRGNKKWKMI